MWSLTNARPWHVRLTLEPGLFQHEPPTGQSASVLHAFPYWLGSPRQNDFQRKHKAPAADFSFGLQPSGGGSGNAYLPQFEKQATVLSPPTGLPALSTMTPLG